jgi:hypothetical protein
VNDAGWGRAVVRQLADHIRKTDPDSKGFSVQNLWRMKQFYETYREREKLSPVVREIQPPWFQNIRPVCRTKICFARNCMSFMNLHTGRLRIRRSGERKTMTNKTPHSFHFREHPR